jgi:hypothetical protein
MPDDSKLQGPVWIVSCGAFSVRENALKQARMIQGMDLSSGVLWMPDYPILGGSRLWMAFAGPIDSANYRRVEDVLAKIKTSIPGAYVIKIPSAQPPG